MYMTIIIIIIVALGSPFASRFLWLWVSTSYRPSLLCMLFSAKLINEIINDNDSQVTMIIY